MKWLGKWMAKQISNAQTDVYGGSEVAVSSHDVGWTESLNIGITSASGGKIVTFRRYNQKTDRNDNRIYVIAEDLDFNHELAKLITLESIRG